MENMPLTIPAVFILTTLLTLYFLYIAFNRSILLLFVLLGWLGLQGAIAATGFYTITDSLPPRFILLPGPPIIAIVLLFTTRKGRAILDAANPTTLTWLHIVRIPVEIVLFWLFLHQAVPKLMTFEGRNFDILSGLTAPLIVWYMNRSSQPNKVLLLSWNFICLILLFNIVMHAILSAPSPFQQLGFDQPNIAILHFPYVWLPGFIVPAVLLSHLTLIRKISKGTLQAAVLETNT